MCMDSFVLMTDIYLSGVASWCRRLIEGFLYIYLFRSFAKYYHHVTDTAGKVSSGGMLTLVSRLSDNKSSSVCVFFTTNIGLIF